MTDRITIAVAGARRFGRKHLQTIATEPGVVVAGVADPSPAARSLAHDAGGIGSMVNWLCSQVALLRPAGSVLLVLRWRLNLLMLGDDKARTLGVEAGWL